MRKLDCHVEDFYIECYMNQLFVFRDGKYAIVGPDIENLHLPLRGDNDMQL